MEAEAAVDLATWIRWERMNWTLFPWELWQLWALEKSLDHKRPTQKNLIINNWYQTSVNYFWQMVICLYWVLYDVL